MTVPEVVDEEEMYNPPDNGQASIKEEEPAVPEVVDEVSDGWQIVVESNSKIEEAPKKSYAYIVSGYYVNPILWTHFLCFLGLFLIHFLGNNGLISKCGG